MKTVVIGASSGLGRCIATGLAGRGERVAALARRYDMLAEVARQAGAGTIAVACDVTDEDACGQAIDEAAEGLGGIDALVYCPAVGPLAHLADTTAQMWRQVFDTNVIGAAVATKAAIAHLTRSEGVALYLSSVSASLTPPWPGLGAYGVSKAALDRLVESWRVEHPEVGFTRVIVGDCAGGEGDAMTQFASNWDRDLAGQLHPVWSQRNYLSGSLLDVDELVGAIHHVLHSAARVPTIAVVPRPRA